MEVHGENMYIYINVLSGISFVNVAELNSQGFLSKGKTKTIIELLNHI